MASRKCCDKSLGRQSIKDIKRSRQLVRANTAKATARATRLSKACGPGGCDKVAAKKVSAAKVRPEPCNCAKKQPKPKKANR